MYSTTLNGNEMATVAWHLDSALPAPRLDFAYQRTAPGQCTSPGVRPQQVGTQFVALIGSGRRDALYDCLSLGLIATESRRFDELADADPVLSSTITTLPGLYGDRTLVRVDLTFARTQPALFASDLSMQLVVGMEDGLVRIVGLRGASDPPLP
jgi:hypothetical protein